MSFIALVPARAGSKGVRNKNFKNFCGKPLIYWTLSEAFKSKYISDIIVSSDCKKILNYCRVNFFHRLKILKRQKKLSLSSSPMHAVIKDAYKKLNLKKKKFTALILLQPTSPLRTVKDIDEACKMFAKNTADSLISISELNHKYNPESLYVKKGHIIKRISNAKITNIRQNKKKYFSNNGAAIYITLKKNINKFIVGGKILGYEMPTNRSIDIDTDYDFKLAELVKINEFF